MPPFFFEQIGKAASNKIQTIDTDNQMDSSEDEDEDVEEFIYGEEDEDSTDNDF